MKQFGPPPPLSKRTALFQLTPIFLSNFFMTPPLCPNFKNEKPPPNFKQRGNYGHTGMIGQTKIYLAYLKLYDENVFQNKQITYKIKQEQK